MHELGVPNLLVSRQPRRGRAGKAGRDLDPRGGQPEHAVKALQILTDIGGTLVGEWHRDKDAHRRGRRSPGPATAGCHKRPGTGAGRSRGPARSTTPRRTTPRRSARSRSPRSWSTWGRSPRSWSGGQRCAGPPRSGCAKFPRNQPPAPRSRALPGLADALAVSTSTALDRACRASESPAGVLRIRSPTRAGFGTVSRATTESKQHHDDP